ncbi:putative toxin-antitoxin system antitoxin component (TIGR02293 family) [Mucilaginibacter rubeus]|uniref:type II RES/Xre toxin-antitoxin system antitoxin n=1 Tax=Mucilaginibacter rubeus TaxID=2027860 RepID=UPI0033945F43
MAEVANHPRKINIADLEIGSPDAWYVFSFLFPHEYLKVHLKCDMDSNIIDCIRGGIPRLAIDSILEKTNVSRAQLSNILHISTRQLNRYGQDDRLSAEQSNFLYEFTRIYIRGIDILGDAATVDKWLMRPNMALGDKQPLELLDTSEGLRMVDDVLSQIEYGFYS